jgi:rhodanese-related sulfurtransferase
MKRLFIPLIALLSFTYAGCAQSQQGKGAAPETAAEAPIALSPQQFKEAIDAGNARLIDVRTPGEYASGHLPQSANMDWTGKDHEQQFAQLDPNEPILLYCRSGGRSGQALEYLHGQGFKNVRHLEGGIGAWTQVGFPTVQ